jgi:hypothetical protein
MPFFGNAPDNPELKADIEKLGESIQQLIKQVTAKWGDQIEVQLVGQIAIRRELQPGETCPGCGEVHVPLPAADGEPDDSPIPDFTTADLDAAIKNLFGKKS